MMDCALCGGTGFVKSAKAEATPGLKGLSPWSVPCECQVEKGVEMRILRAKIPPAFAGASLENYRPQPHTKDGFLLARRYAEEFLPANNRVTDATRPGLLFAGSVGTGKTHLSVGIVKAIARRGFDALFVDVRELYDRLRHSYDDGAHENQAQIFARIWKADMVVIDELGAARPTDWIFETTELLIGGLYNRAIATIVTTNLPNMSAAGAAVGNEYARAARTETLGDRIGSRMWSRLQQMCRPVEMTGPDWRTKHP